MTTTTRGHELLCIIVISLLLPGVISHHTSTMQQTSTRTYVLVSVFVVSLSTSVTSQTSGNSVNMDDPNGDHYCPMPRDPNNLMSYRFKEDTCETYLGWCENLDTHPFSPTSGQAKWWDVLSVEKFYDHMESDAGPRRRGKRQAMRRRAVRRDYRLLSREERERFHRAVQRLKESFMDGTRTYDLFVGYHQASMAPGAHFGPAFMPWHREFLLRFENALREIDPSVSLPYWDSSLDHALGNSSIDSVMWTGEFVGNAMGDVTEGPFANWPIPFTSNGNRRLYRDILNTAGRGRGPQLFHDRAMASIVDAPDFRSITWNVDSAYEAFHGATHNYIGGIMTDLANSPSDPTFFLHHAFLDCLFERMRSNHRARGLDVRYYFPNDTRAMGVGRRQPDGSTLRNVEDSLHYALAPMEPFAPLRNIDGLRDEYTARYYTCAPSASCSRRNLDCGSEVLFCYNAPNTVSFSCAPRLKLGARCSQFDVSRDENANPCYQSACCDGVCSNSCENTVEAQSEVSQNSIEEEEVSVQERQPERSENEVQERMRPANVIEIDRRGNAIEIDRRPVVDTVAGSFTLPPVPTHGPFPTHPPVPTHPPSHLNRFFTAVSPVGEDRERERERERRRPPPPPPPAPAPLSPAISPSRPPPRRTRLFPEPSTPRRPSPQPTTPRRPAPQPTTARRPPPSPQPTTPRRNPFDFQRRPSPSPSRRPSPPPSRRPSPPPSRPDFSRDQPDFEFRGNRQDFDFRGGDRRFGDIRDQSFFSRRFNPFERRFDFRNRFDDFRFRF